MSGYAASLQGFKTAPTSEDNKASIKNLDRWLLEVYEKLNLKLLDAFKKIEDLETKMETKDEKISELEAQIASKNSSTSSSFADITKRNEKNKLPKESLQLINLITDEKSLIKKRENNLIIKGIKEFVGEEAEIKIKETEMVKKIIDETKINVTIKYNQRIGKKHDDTNKSRPILITLENNSQIVPILKASKSLRNNDEYKDIYINKHLTDAESLKEYELRKERKTKNEELWSKDSTKEYIFCIRNNQLVKQKNRNKPTTPNNTV